MEAISKLSAASSLRREGMKKYHNPLRWSVQAAAFISWFLLLAEKKIQMKTTPPRLAVTFMKVRRRPEHWTESLESLV